MTPARAAMHGLVQAIAVLAVLAALPSAARADFVLISQNALHLGYGNSKISNYISKKNDFLQTYFSKADVVVIQEVMKPADPLPATAAAPNRFTPATYSYWPATASADNWPNLKGLSKYKEAYALLYNPATMNLLCTHPAPATLSGVTFERPPDAYLVQSTTSTLPTTQQSKPTWIVNFHAVWGNSVGGRVAEAKAVGVFAMSLRTMQCGTYPKTDRVILAGDWNLPAHQVKDALQSVNAFPTAPLTVAPTGETTVNPQGTTASAYDHFVFDGKITAVPGSVKIFDPTTASITLHYFRHNVSDHLGITIKIKD